MKKDDENGMNYDHDIDAVQNWLGFMGLCLNSRKMFCKNKKSTE